MIEALYDEAAPTTAPEPAPAMAPAMAPAAASAAAPPATVEQRWRPLRFPEGTQVEYHSFDERTGWCWTPAVVAPPQPLEDHHDPGAWTQNRLRPCTYTAHTRMWMYAHLPYLSMPDRVYLRDLDGDEIVTTFQYVRRMTLARRRSASSAVPPVRRVPAARLRSASALPPTNSWLYTPLIHDIFVTGLPTGDHERRATEFRALVPVLWESVVHAVRQAWTAARPPANEDPMQEGAIARVQEQAGYPDQADGYVPAMQEYNGEPDFLYSDDMPSIVEGRGFVQETLLFRSRQLMYDISILDGRLRQSLGVDTGRLSPSEEETRTTGRPAPRQRLVDAQNAEYEASLEADQEREAREAAAAAAVDSEGGVREVEVEAAAEEEEEEEEEETATSARVRSQRAGFLSQF